MPGACHRVDVSKEARRLDCKLNLRIGYTRAFVGDMVEKCIVVFSQGYLIDCLKLRLTSESEGAR